VAAIGGIMVSTFLTLIYVPIFFTIFEDITGWISSLTGRLFGHEAKPSPSADPVNVSP
jgi:hypothetical protein